jgi:hypothetical protein
MEYICKDCFENSKSHSFNLLTKYNLNNHLFYTKIADAEKYNDSDGIINHYKNYLNYINPEKWTWIVDFDNFELKHYFEIKTTIRLANLIKEFGKIDKIIIINSNSFVKLLLKITSNIINNMCEIIIFSKNDKQELKKYLKNINIDDIYLDFLCYRKVLNLSPLKLRTFR